MNYAGIAFQISAVCSGCGRSVPLNGAYTEFDCPKCESKIETPPDFWRDLLIDPVNEALNLKEKRFFVVKVSYMKYGLSVKLKYGRMNPRCTSPCRREFTDSEIHSAIIKESHVLDCHECGRAEDSRLPPEWFKKVDKKFSLLIGESKGASMEVRRWYVVVEMGNAVGVVPRRALKLCDITPTMKGNLVLAWHEEDGEGVGRNPRLALADGNGLLRWVQSRLDFSENAYLMTSPENGRIYLTDTQEGFILGFDPANGSMVQTMNSPPGRDPGSLNVRDTRRIFMDKKGFFYVFGYWDGMSGKNLKRFDNEGKPVPVWPGQASSEWAKQPVHFHWHAPADYPVHLPDNILCSMGWDGFFYIVDRSGQRIARYTEDGKLADILPCPNDIITRVRSFGVDKNGLIFMLFKHAEPIGGDLWPHVAKLNPKTEVLELLLGPHAEGPIEQKIIGRRATRMKLTPDGVLVLAGGMSSLRTIGPDGTVLWRSHRTIENDAKLAEKIRNEQ